MLHEWFLVHCKPKLIISVFPLSFQTNFEVCTEQTDFLGGWMLLLIWLYVIGCVEEFKRLKYNKVHCAVCQVKRMCNLVWTWAHSFDHFIVINGSTLKEKNSQYFSNLGKSRRTKRGGHQQRGMRTPAVRKGQTTRTETPGKKDTHTHQERGRNGLRCRYWHNPACSK